MPPSMQAQRVQPCMTSLDFSFLPFDLVSFLNSYNLSRFLIFLLHLFLSLSLSLSALSYSVNLSIVPSRSLTPVDPSR